jgi:hypothetical protein
MKNEKRQDKWVSLDISQPIWGRVFTVAPLVVIGTKEGEEYDLAPKHMVTPLGHDNFFGFVCTPKHATYHNAKKEKAFTVSFVTPKQVVLASLTATPRCEDVGWGAGCQTHSHSKGPGSRCIGRSGRLSVFGMPAGPDRRWLWRLQPDRRRNHSSLCEEKKRFAYQRQMMRN